MKRSLIIAVLLLAGACSTRKVDPLLVPPEADARPSAADNAPAAEPEQPKT